MYRKQSFQVAAVAALSLFGAVSTTHASFVDMFNDAPFQLGLIPGDDAVSTTVAGDPSSILGGERFIQLSYVLGGNSDAANASYTAGNDSIFYENQGDAMSALVFNYGMSGDLNADFESIATALLVDFSSVTGIGELTVQIISGPYTGVSATQIVDSPGSYAFSFEEQGFRLLNLFSVDQISIRLEAITPGTDFNMSGVSLQAIPAPGALALLGIAGLCRRRRRGG